MASATPASRPADPASAVPVHAEPLAVLWERTSSRPGGLTAEEVEQRRGTAVVRTEDSPAMAIFEEVAESLAEPLMLLLLLVAVLSAIFGELRDAIAIFVVIVIIGAVEAIAEVRAKRALGALRDLSAPNALVRRAGVAEAVPVGGLVVGDVLLVEAGSLVAADARVVEADGLATDESRLTGYPGVAAKGADPVAADTPLAERSSLLHAGTAVVCVSDVVYSTGQRLDVAGLAEAAHRNGALLIIDATQSAGGIPIDVGALGVDALITASYKWLCGPFGVAVMYLAPHLHERLEPGLVGFRSHEQMWDLRADRLKLPPNAHRFEFSTMAYGCAPGLASSIDYLLRLDVGRIFSRNKTLADLLIEGLRERNAEILSPTYDGAP